MKFKDIFDILTSVVLMMICIGFIENRVLVLQVDPFEIVALIASLWATFRLAERVIAKINNLRIQNKIKDKNIK